jgi:hypothetical protein
MRSHRSIALHDTAGGLVALGDERPPLQYLAHVLQRDDARAHLAGPAPADPRQCAAAFVSRLTAGRLAVVRAVRREVQITDRASLRCAARAHLEHVGDEVPGLRVVRAVHAQRVVVVVDGDIGRAAECMFAGNAQAAATSEQIHDQFIVKQQAVLGVHAAPPFRSSAARLAALRSRLRWAASMAAASLPARRVEF